MNRCCAIWISLSCGLFDKSLGWLLVLPFGFKFMPTLLAFAASCDAIACCNKIEESFLIGSQRQDRKFWFESNFRVRNLPVATDVAAAAVTAVIVEGTVHSLTTSISDFRLVCCFQLPLVTPFLTTSCTSRTHRDTSIWCIVCEEWTLHLWCLTGGLSLWWFPAIISCWWRWRDHRDQSPACKVRRDPAQISPWWEDD